MDDATALPFNGDRFGCLQLEAAVVDLDVEVLLHDLNGGIVACSHGKVLLGLDGEILGLGFDLNMLLGEKFDVGSRLQLDVLILGHQPLVVFDEDLMIVTRF